MRSVLPIHFFDFKPFTSRIQANTLQYIRQVSTGATSCNLHVQISLWIIPKCAAPISVQQNNQLRRAIGIGRSALSRWLMSRYIRIFQKHLEYICSFQGVVNRLTRGIIQQKVSCLGLMFTPLHKGVNLPVSYDQAHSLVCSFRSVVLPQYRPHQHKACDYN